MMPSAVQQPISPYSSHPQIEPEEDDADTASQRSISLSSPAVSPRHSNVFHSSHDSEALSKRGSHTDSLDTDFKSEADDASLYTHDAEPHETPNTSAAPSVFDEPKVAPLPTYPPAPLMESMGDTASVTSFASGSSYSKKARPESMVLTPDGPLVLGIALVDFNHLVHLVHICAYHVYLVIYPLTSGRPQNRIFLGRYF